MSSNGGMTKLYLFVLVLNLIFPVLSYTFTAFEDVTENYETSLNPDSLMRIGLNLVDGESHNFTFNADDWVEYLLLNTTIRAKWHESKRGLLAPVIDAVEFQKQSTISKAFDSWFSPYTIFIKSVSSNEWYQVLRNDTIVRDFDTQYNWSRFVLEDGHHVFITPFEDDGNITKAVYEDGHLNITLAKSFEEEDTTFNFWRFIGWYSSLMLGDQSWGLPSIFGWVIRILGALSVFAVVMLTKELISL